MRCTAKFKFGILIIFSLLLFCSCGNTETGKKEVLVFAASSLTEPLEEIKALYESRYDDISIVYNFESSGTLKTQISEGANCDLFISAALKQMNELENSGLIKTDTRIDLLENQVVLAVSDKDLASVYTFRNLKDALLSNRILLAIGNEDVPAGQYAVKILNYLGLSDDEISHLSSITFGNNVKEVTALVKEASADCGIIYATDACSAGLNVADTADKEMCGQVLYPAGILTEAPHKKEAYDFLSFLTDKEACEIFKEIGFTPLFD